MSASAGNLGASAARGQHKTLSKEEILRALCDADALRDANELMRLCILMLHYGHCSSLAAVEEHFRWLRLNARLIAVPFDKSAVPSGVVCRNPFRLDNRATSSDLFSDSAGSALGGDLSTAADQNCAFCALLSVEGEQAARNECEQIGAETEETNMNRLRGDCGFLVLPTGHNTQQSWRKMLESFAGDVQRADERATFVSGVRSCAACGRFQTQNTELRPLACCDDQMVCSEQCWIAHIEQDHSEVAIFRSAAAENNA